MDARAATSLDLVRHYRALVGSADAIERHHRKLDKLLTALEQHERELAAAVVAEKEAAQRYGAARNRWDACSDQLLAVLPLAELIQQAAAQDARTSPGLERAAARCTELVTALKERRTAASAACEPDGEVGRALDEASARRRTIEVATLASRGKHHDAVAADRSADLATATLLLPLLEAGCKALGLDP